MSSPEKKRPKKSIPPPPPAKVDDDDIDQYLIPTATAANSVSPPPPPPPPPPSPPPPPAPSETPTAADEKRRNSMIQQSMALTRVAAQYEQDATTRGAIMMVPRSLALTISNMVERSVVYTRQDVTWVPKETRCSDGTFVVQKVLASASIYGFEKLEEMMSCLVHRPGVLSNTYSRIASVTSFHFAVVGPRHCGRRTAITHMAKAFNVGLRILDANTYIPGMLAPMISESLREGRCIIYIDGVERLAQNTAFYQEFKQQVLATNFSKTFSGVWIAFALETDALLKDPNHPLCLRDLVHKHVAHYEQPECRVIASVLLQTFLVTVLNCEINPMLTTAQYDILSIACQDALIGHVYQFATEICEHAMRRVSQEDLYRRDGCAGNAKIVIDTHQAADISSSRTVITWDNDIYPLLEMVPDSVSATKRPRIPTNL